MAEREAVRDEETLADRPALIHATAQVAPGARLGHGVVVGANAVVAEDVTVGAGTRIGAHAVLQDGVRIGRDNEISAGVVLGCLPQDRHFLGEESFVVIGDRNYIREYASVSRATGQGGATTIGDDAYIMSYVRIDHNCRIGDRVVIVSGCQLAGHVTVEEDAYLGGMAGVHQFVHVGRLAMVGGYAVLRQDAPPFFLTAGYPARARGLNLVGLRRKGFTPRERSLLRRAFHVIYQSRLGITRGVETLAAEHGDDPLAAEVVAFFRAARQRERGVVRWGRADP